TIATNLAVALARLGAKVGLLDADITGPNVPTMLGIEHGALSEGQGGLHTIEAYGVKAASIGFVLPKGTPVVWRGPMIGSGGLELPASIREGVDNGQPIVAGAPDSPEAQTFLRLAEQVAARCSVLRYSGEAAVA